MKRILVTGAARSGTGYVAEYLRSFVQIPNCVGHENVYGLHHEHEGRVTVHVSKLDQPPSWGTYQVESSWLAAPFLSSAAPDRSIVVHLVRDPIKAISSIYRRGFLRPGNAYGEFANKNLGGDLVFFEAYRDPLLRACHYWCEWNLMILTSKCPVAVWRVESLASADLAYVLDTAGIPYRPHIPPMKGVNSGGDRLHDPWRVPYSLRDIPTKFRGRVVEVGALFGYEVK
jgi:hypothetical protein